MMAHTMSQINRISCVAEISIFGINKYWHTDLNLMDINIISIFKQLLQDETVNADKKLYYQR